MKKAVIFTFFFLVANSSACFAAGVNSPSVILKFFTAMFGVLISALVIFAGLKLYQKLTLKNQEKSDNIDYDKNLETPKDFKEAINLFLNKTDR